MKLRALMHQLVPLLPMSWSQIAKQGRVPAAQHVIKLAGRYAGGAILWHGRLRC